MDRASRMILLRCSDWSCARGSVACANGPSCSIENGSGCRACASSTSIRLGPCCTMRTPACAWQHQRTVAAPHPTHQAPVLGQRPDVVGDHRASFPCGLPALDQTSCGLLGSESFLAHGASVSGQLGYTPPPQHLPSSRRPPASASRTPRHPSPASMPIPRWSVSGEQARSVSRERRSSLPVGVRITTRAPTRWPPTSIY
jgi:hypothetical protein